MQDWLISFNSLGKDISNFNLLGTGRFYCAQWHPLSGRQFHKYNYTQLLWQHRCHVLAAKRDYRYFGSCCISSPSPGFVPAIQYSFSYVQLCNHIPGCQNVMTDILSHHRDLSDMLCLFIFILICYLRQKLNSTLTLTLSLRQCNPELLNYIPEKRMNIMSFGSFSVPKLEIITTLKLFNLCKTIGHHKTTLKPTSFTSSNLT